MYERFTDRARKIMQLANQEAQRLNHTYIGVEHILIGVCKEGSGVACTALKNMGVQPGDVVKALRDKLNPGSVDTAHMGKLPQTPEARKLVEWAIHIARDMHHNYIGSEHILLAALTVWSQGGPLADALAGLGLTRERVLQETKTLWGIYQGQPKVESDRPTPPPQTFVTTSGPHKPGPGWIVVSSVTEISPDGLTATCVQNWRQLFSKEEPTPTLDKCVGLLERMADAAESPSIKAAYKLAAKKMREECK